MSNKEDPWTPQTGPLPPSQKQNLHPKPKTHPQGQSERLTFSERNTRLGFDDMPETDAEEGDKHEALLSKLDERVCSFNEGEMKRLSVMTQPPAVGKVDKFAVVNAMEEIRANEFAEDVVLDELRKIFELYINSQKKALSLNETITKYQDIIEHYEDKRQQDDRVRRALYIAQDHRQALVQANKKNIEYKQKVKEARFDLVTTTDQLDMVKKQLGYKQIENRRLVKAVRAMEETAAMKLKLENIVVELRKELEGIARVHDQQREVDKELIKEKYDSEFERKNEKIERLMSRLDDCYLHKWSYWTANETYRRHINGLEQQIADTNETLYKCIERQKSFKRKRNMMDANVELLRRLLKKRDLKYKELLVQNEKDRELLREQTRNGQIKQKENEELQSRLYEVEKQSIILRKQVYSTEEGMKEARRLLQASKDDGNFSNLAIKDLETKVLTCNKEINTCKQRCRTLSHHLNIVITDNSKKDVLLRCSEKNAQLLTTEIREQTSESTHKETIITTLSSDLTRLHNQMMDVTWTLKKYRDAHAQMLKDLHMLDNQQERLLAKVEVKEKDNISLRMRNSNLFVESATQSELIEALQHQRVVKDRELKTLTYTERKREATVQTLIQRAEEDLHKINSKNKDITRLENDLKDMRAEVDMRKHQLLHFEKRYEEKIEELRLAAKKGEQIRKQRDIAAGMSTQKKVELELVEMRMRAAEEKLEFVHEEYQKKCNDVRVLVIETKNLRRKLKVFDTMKAQLFELRLKYQDAICAAQQKATENAALAKLKQQNIHRWTRLKIADPSVFELHLKQHHLTKCLIKKTEEVIEKEQIIVQRNKIFSEMKTQLESSLELNAVQELTEAQTELRRKDRQIKALKAELTVCLHSEREAKYMVQEGDMEKDEVKKKYFKEKRINARLKQKQKGEPKLPPIQPKPPGIRRVGGGFKRSFPTRTVQKEFIVTGTGRHNDRPHR